MWKLLPGINFKGKVNVYNMFNSITFNFYILLSSFFQDILPLIDIPTEKEGKILILGFWGMRTMFVLF